MCRNCEHAEPIHDTTTPLALKKFAMTQSFGMISETAGHKRTASYGRSFCYIVQPGAVGGITFTTNLLRTSASAENREGRQRPTLDISCSMTQRFESTRAVPSANAAPMSFTKGFNIAEDLAEPATVTRALDRTGGTVLAFSQKSTQVTPPTGELHARPHGPLDVLIELVAERTSSKSSCVH